MFKSETWPPTGIVSVAMEPVATTQITATPKSPPQTKQTLAREPSTGLARSHSSTPVKSRSGRKQMKTQLEAWYYNPNSEEDLEEKDPTLPHHFKPDQQVPQEHLETLGVLVWTAIQTRNYQQNQRFQQVKNERGYNYEEVVTVAPDRLANYDQKKREFFKEHLHEHEEIRLILEGSGYEDIRDFDGSWIRIHITKGVLIVLPKGMYHRFTLDDTNYLKAVLLYQESPSRIQFDRGNAETDIMEVREQYVSNVLSRGTSCSLLSNSSEFSGMLEGLEEEMEVIRARQEIVESTLDESNSYAEALKASQAKAKATKGEEEAVNARLALVAQKLQTSVDADADADPPAVADEPTNGILIDTHTSPTLTTP